MAITRTPASAALKPTADEKQIAALINKGGSSTQAKETTSSSPETDSDPVKTVLLRLYESQVKEVDELLAQLPRRQRPSRNAFIVEAIEDRLKRDKAKRK